MVGDHISADIRRRKGKQMRLKAPPRSDVLLPKGFITFPNSTTNWGPLPLELFKPLWVTF